MISLDKVSLTLDQQTILREVTLHMPRGAHWALMGPSGCGKTSLLHLIAGLIPPTEGTVSVSSTRIAFAFQEPRLLPSRTALQNVNLVLGDRRSTLPEAADRLRAVGLADDMDKYPAELSGGMAQRVNLARALAYDAELLLLDEPFQGLDDARKRELTDLIARHAKNRTLLLATHDRSDANTLCDGLLTFRNQHPEPADA